MKLTIDGIEIEADARPDDLSRRPPKTGIEIPTLCHTPGLDPVGVCRMCVVDVGERGEGRRLRSRVHSRA